MTDRQNPPTVDMPLNEAVRKLTFAEYRYACKFLKVKDLSDAGGIGLIGAAVWLYERRKDPGLDIDTFGQRFDLGQCTDYFADESDDDEQETED